MIHRITTSIRSLVSDKIFVGKIVFVVATIFLLSTNTTHAIDLFGITGVWDFFAQATAFIVNIVLSITSWFVALTGTLLNVSINMTMHIKDFVDSTPAIYDVWKAIRDITGLFIIFALLYASIRMILGQDAKLGDLLKNIVVAGVLINFSFFITAVLIDASNIVSLQLYKAITPGQPDIGQIIRGQENTTGTLAQAGTIPSIVTALFDDGGISAIFMQSLQIQTAFHPNNLNLQNKQSSTGMTPFRIVFIGVTGIVIMVTVGLSFLFASLAFVVRLVLLIILLAFSPIWCAAAVVPQLQKYSKEWWEILTNQLIFMPAYLLLMYVAMKILTGSNLFNTGAYGNLWQGSDTAAPTEFISFAINAVFIIVMLNIPLLAAIKLGASVGGIVDGNKLGAGALWKKVGGWAGGTAGRGTLGIAGSKLDARLANTRIGNSMLGRDLRSVTTQAMAKGKFGSGRSYEDVEKINKEIKKKGREFDRVDSLRRALGTAGTTPDQLREIINSMGEPEKMALDPIMLKDPRVLQHLKKSDFEAIKKSDDDDISKDDKTEISRQRTEAMKSAVTANDDKVVMHMIRNMETDDLLKFINEQYAGVATVPEGLVKNLTRGNLEALGKERLDTNIKKVIGQQIYAWDLTHPASHPAEGFVRKNLQEWTGIVP